jgi:hypothetical protein
MISKRLLQKVDSSFAMAAVSQGRRLTELALAVDAILAVGRYPDRSQCPDYIPIGTFWHVVPYSATPSSGWLAVLGSSPLEAITLSPFLRQSSECAGTEHQFQCHDGASGLALRAARFQQTYNYYPIPKYNIINVGVLIRTRPVE